MYVKQQINHRHYLFLPTLTPSRAPLRRVSSSSRSDTYSLDWIDIIIIIRPAKRQHEGG